MLHNLCTRPSEFLAWMIISHSAIFSIFIKVITYHTWNSSSQFVGLSNYFVIQKIQEFKSCWKYHCPASVLCPVTLLGPNPYLRRTNHKKRLHQSSLIVQRPPWSSSIPAVDLTSLPNGRYSIDGLFDGKKLFRETQFLAIKSFLCTKNNKFTRSLLLQFSIHISVHVLCSRAISVGFWQNMRVNGICLINIFSVQRWTVWMS